MKKQAPFVRPSRCAVEETKEKKIIAIIKLFALYANAKMTLKISKRYNQIKLFEILINTTLRCKENGIILKILFDIKLKEYQEENILDTTRDNKLSFKTHQVYF